MIRVVADSNIYISALNFGGVADEVLSLARCQAIELFVSPPLLSEIEGVLIRKFKWSAKQVRQARTLIQAFADTVVPEEKIAVVTADEPDNRILECAVAARAHLIVTGDHHLLTLERFRSTAILSPREFLDAKVWEA